MTTILASLLTSYFLVSTTVILASINPFEAQKADEYSIDGQADESFWNHCEWYAIDHVWIPYGAEMEPGDFSGKVRFAWTEEVLLVFAEIEDNMLSDDHQSVFDQYWEDDCLEIFVDEDHSGGWHQDGAVAYNAFAYHCAINEQDVVDIGHSGNVLLNEHVEYDIDTSGNNHYTWEMAVKIYDDSYVENGANTPVTLFPNKELGLSLAYCDNDETTGRENFIGLVDVPEAQYNSAWQDADVFGTLLLKDTEIYVSDNLNKIQPDILVYPTIVSNQVFVETKVIQEAPHQIYLYDLFGRILLEMETKKMQKETILLEDIFPGIYVLTVIGNGYFHSQRIIKKY